jgi:Protein of unknown function (DUF3830)
MCLFSSFFLFVKSWGHSRLENAGLKEKDCWGLRIEQNYGIYLREICENRKSHSGISDLDEDMAQISIKIENEKFTANLHQEKAPNTIKALERVFPYSSKVIHARFSGEAIWVPLPGDFPVNVQLEGQTSYPSKGELLYYPGFVSEKEILIPYGAAQFSSKVGLLPGNHFASILSADLPRLAQMGNKVLWEGAKTILIEKLMD